MSKYDLPEAVLTPSVDLEQANQANYLAWKAQQAARKRSMTTQFNAFQGRSFARLCQHAEWKETTADDIDALKDDITRRIVHACDCEACEKAHEELLSEQKRRGSVGGSSLDSRRSEDDVKSVKGPNEAAAPTAPSMPKSTSVGAPPRSRHHSRSASRGK